MSIPQNLESTPPVLAIHSNFADATSTSVMQVRAVGHKVPPREPRLSNGRCCRGIRCDPGDNYTIFVMPGPDRDAAVGLAPAFIYAPIWRSLLDGLQRKANLCGYKVLLARNNVYPHKPAQGDVIIFVGLPDAHKFEHECRTDFAPRGVYCIYYSTEHEFTNGGYSNVLASPHICEIWEYTRANRPNSSLVRYVPPGFVPLNGNVEQNDAFVRNANRIFDDKNLTLFFDGDLSDIRKVCWERLQTVPYFAHFKHRFWLFDDDAWAKLMSDGNQVFLNVHKLRLESGAEHKPLETVRVGRLLSMGVVILTEQINSDDAKLYDGMILVENNLCNANGSSMWSPFLRELLGNGTKLRLWQTRAYAAFKTIFDSQKVLEDAEVWDGGRRNQSDPDCA